MKQMRGKIEKKIKTRMKRKRMINNLQLQVKKESPENYVPFLILPILQNGRRKTELSLKIKFL